MMQLTIDPSKCNACRTCETILPDLLTKATDSRLLISSSNIKTHGPTIHMAINSCQNQALALEKINV